MNKNSYKVIFNKHRGQMMAVAENTVRNGKSPADQRSNNNSIITNLLASIPVLTSSILIGLGLCVFIDNSAIASDIHADTSAPKNQRPTIMKSANGTAQVNIQTPSKKGVSINQYRQFDVNQKGAILNNSRKNTQTQLGGWVQANPWLAAGEARIIVNQINSRNPSQLNGYVEVAGRRAEVIMANPAGISVNGGGFINAAGVTLTTGKPILDNGDLHGFQVQEGNISINGQGLDTSGSDYTHLLTQAARINAGIWANNLNITAGSYDIDSQGQISQKQPDASNSNTGIAIDTAQLGGMYAGKITLVSNDKGVGVNNAGQIFAGAGGVVVSADGKLSNSGTIVAADKTQSGASVATATLQANHIDNSGTISSQGKMQTRSQQLENSGLLASADELNIRNQHTLSNQGEINAGRLDIDSNRLENRKGKIIQTGLQGLAMNAEHVQNINNSIIGYPPVVSDSTNPSDPVTPIQPSEPDTPPTTATGAGKTDNTPNVTAPRTFASGQINVHNDIINDNSQIIANSGIDLSSQHGLTNQATLKLNQLQVSGALLDNQQGKLNANQATITTTKLDNRHGEIFSNNQFHYSGEQLLNNQGKLQSANQLEVHTEQLDNSDNGLIAVQNQLQLHSSEHINNSNKGQISSNQQAIINSQQINNQSGAIDSGSLNLNAQSVDNRQGAIRSNTQLQAQIDSSLNNQNGTLSSAGDLSINNNGTSQLNIDNSQGKIIVGQQANINSTILNNQQGSIDAESIYLKADEINNNQGAIRANKQLNAQINHHLNNQQGQISSAEDLHLHDQQQQSLHIDNRDNGKILAGKDLTLQSKHLDNTGTIAANGHASLSLIDDFEIEADLNAGGDLNISSQGDIINNKTLSAGKGVRLNGAKITNNSAGTIQSNQHTELKANHSITNRGLINSNGTTLLQSGEEISNIGSGRIYGNHIAIGTQKLINREENLNGSSKAAVIAARGRLDIGAKDIINQEHALLSSEGDIAIGGALDNNHHATGLAEHLINSSARIEAQGNGSIAVKELQNLNNHFAVEEYLDSDKRVEQYQEIGNPAIWVHGVDGKFERRRKELKFTFNDGSEKIWDKNTPVFPHWWDFKRKTYKQKVTKTDPGEIIIGGDLSISGNHWINDNSHIIVGHNLIGGDSLNLENRETKGVQRVEEHGTEGGYKYNNPKFSKGRIEVTGRKSYNRTIVTSHEFDTPVSVIQQNVQTGPNQAQAEQTNIHQQQKQNHAENQLNQLNQFIQTQKHRDIKLPNSSLYHINPNNQGYLIETDPAYTNMHKWLGSDYMLSALGQDPNKMQKRLGDGYYEQRLINEQIAKLTGYRRLKNYENDEEQYKALMNAGITYAQQYSLVPGVALSAEQMANLTSDIVWLVNETVTLADGSSQNVLVPKVYLIARSGDVDDNGSLISARNMQLQNSGHINNQGTLAAQNIINLGAQNIDNSGLISGDKVALNATENINFNGGSAVAKDILLVNADKVNLNTTTVNYGDSRNGGTVVDRMAGLYVTGEENGILSVSGTHGISTHGATITNDANNGLTQLRAKEGSIDLGTVTTAINMAYGNSSDKNHWINRYQDEIGTNINAVGDINILANEQLNIRQGDINSDYGVVNLYGKNSVNISEGRQNTELDHSVYRTSSGFLSKKTQLDQHQANYDEAVASDITGAIVNISSDQDINIRGSNIISDIGTVLRAGHDVNISAASSQYQDRVYHKETKSGLMGSGGIGFSIGKQKETDETISKSLIHSGSNIGSLGGDTIIVAGNHYNQTGSSVTTPAGSVTITAKDINIAAAQNQYSSDNIHTFEKSGLTVAVNVPVISTIQTANTAINRVGKSKNKRVNAMAAFNAGIDSYKANQTLTEAFKDPQSAAKSVSVSISVGQQKSRSENHTKDTVASASQINAGGTVNLLATGAGKDSNINIIGSDVAGSEGTYLQADNNINLLAAEQNHSERSSNKSSGWNAGVSIGFGSGRPLIGYTLGVNRGKGYGNGDETTYRNSHVGSTTGNTSIISGGATNIIGAQVIGKGVSIEAAELNIESLQDKATYDSKQENISGQVTVGYGASGSANYSKSKIKADYAAVTEQSGIIAGDDGYQIKVKGNTDLKGAIITSNSAAETAGKNRLNTGSLTYSDIKNHSDYKGSSIGLGLNCNYKGGWDNSIKDSKTGQSTSNGSSSLGYGSDSGHASSITHSGINTSNIIIVDEAAQQQKTGKTAAEAITAIHTDRNSEDYANKAGYLQNNFDKDQVQKELDLQREVSQEFSANMQTASAIINSKKDALKEKLKNETLSTEEREKYEKQLSQWNAGGLILNAIGAGLAAPTNNIGGIIAATASPVVSYEIGQYFKNKNAEGSTAHLIAHAILGAAVSAAGGNDALAGALAASGSEAVAPIISKWLYGKEGKDLTAEEKSTISAISGLIGSATGATIGGGMADVAQGNQAGHTAVDNNRLAIDLNKSDQKAVNLFHQKIKKELGNKFELKGTGKYNSSGYEIMELVPIGNNTVNNLSSSELAFYTMLNEVITDPTGTAQMIFVYDDDQVAGGSWKYNKFDVADMEKLDNNKIILSGNVLITHELNEQLEKDKMGLKPGQGANDINFEKAHLKAIGKESLVLPTGVVVVEEFAGINGVAYDKLYYDPKSKKMYGVNLGQFINDSYRLRHIFKPWQRIIKPNKVNGKFIIYNPKNPSNHFYYP